MSQDTGTELARLKNLGPESARWLAEMGVTTRADLERLGPVGAYEVLRAEGYNASLNLVYAIWGALNDTDWRRIPPEVKARLQAEAGPSRLPDTT